MKTVDHIRPRFAVPEATTLRDSLRKIVVADLFNTQLTEDELNSLVLFESKLTMLLAMHDAREIARRIQSG